MGEPRLYLRVKAELEREIRDHLKPHDRVPSEKVLAERFGVSMITTKSAITTLVAQGLVYRIPGKGTFVAEPPAAQPDRLLRPAGLAIQPGESATQLVGLVCPDFDHRHTVRIFGGVEQTLSEHGYGLVVRRSGNSQKAEEAILQELVGQGVRGVIIYPVDEESFSEEILRLSLTGFPIVLVDRYLRHVRTNAVHSDNLGGAQALITHLLGLGHRTIGLVFNPWNNVAIEDRVEGYACALAEAGVPIDRRLWLSRENTLINPGPPQREQCVPAIQRFIAANPEMTAIFATTYHPMVQYTLEALEQIGMRVPEDMSVVCFDFPEDDLGLPLPFQLTTVVQDERRLGREAASLLLQQMAGTSGFATRIVPPRLFAGASTGPPPVRS